MKKETLYFILIIIGILGTIGIIMLNNSSDIEEETAECIADNSKLYVSKTCTHCAAQKEILSDYLDRFTIIDCTEEQQECLQAGITAVPTWSINNQNYVGVKSIEKLKELTQC